MIRVMEILFQTLRGIPDFPRHLSNAIRGICQEILGVVQSQLTKIIPHIDGIHLHELTLEIRVRHLGQKGQVLCGDVLMIVQRQPKVDFCDTHGTYPLQSVRKHLFEGRHDR